MPDSVSTRPSFFRISLLGALIVLAILAIGFSFESHYWLVRSWFGMIPPEEVACIFPDDSADPQASGPAPHQGTYLDPPDEPIPAEALMQSPKLEGSVSISSDRVLEVYSSRQKIANSESKSEHEIGAVWANVVNRQGIVLFRALEPIPFGGICYAPCPDHLPCHFQVARGKDRIGLAFQKDGRLCFAELRIDGPTGGRQVSLKTPDGTVYWETWPPLEYCTMPGDRPTNIGSWRRVLNLSSLEYVRGRWRATFVNHTQTVVVAMTRSEAEKWVGE